MGKINRRTLVCLFLAVLFAFSIGIFVFRFFRDGAWWACFSANDHLYTEGVLSSGTVLDRNGVILAEGDEGSWQYNEDPLIRKATLHGVGDQAGKIGVGGITAFAHKLSGYNLLTGARPVLGTDRKVWLSLDSQLCATAYREMNGLKGCVGIYNYQTGEILCMVSAPSFDPLAPEEVDENDPAYDGVYINRFLSSSFIPGSTFKLVTTAAALENIPDIMQRTFTCSGSLEVPGTLITCPNVHGEMILQDALTASCNCVYAQLALELGAEVMESYTRKCLLTTAYSVDGIKTATSSFDFTAGEDALAWSGVGQGLDLVNPCAMMVYAGAVAGGGQAAVPHLISRVTTEDDLRISLYNRKKVDLALTEQTVKYLEQMMRDNVSDGYGSQHFSGLNVGAKTGTAEADNSEDNNAWFVGFLQEEDHPYAFVVYLEGGGSGSDLALQVASRVLATALEMGY